MATTKDARLEMRLSEDHKRLLEQAAALAGQPLTSFAVSHLLEDAQEILDRHRRTTLSAADQKRFVEILDSDEQPAPALKKAVKRYKKNRGR